MTDNNETNKPIPCPFCGGENPFLQRDNNGNYVRCRNIKCWCRIGNYPTEAEAIAAWNRRAWTNATNVREIVAGFLKANGFDGLVNVDAECGCYADDLFPCSSDNCPDECQPSKESYLGQLEIPDEKPRMTNNAIR